MTIESIQPAPSEGAEESLQCVKGAVQTLEGSQEVEKTLSYPTSSKDAGVSRNPSRYIINVRVDEQVTRRFITTTPISLQGAVGIRGRGTRVWKAHEIINEKEGDQEVAVKDYWIDANREREGDIVKDIIATAPNEACRTLLKNHIVDVLCHGDVYREHVSIIEREERQPVKVEKMMRNSTRDLKGAIGRRNPVMNRASVTPHTYPMSSLSKRRPPLGTKIRNQLVTKQIGKPLHAENSLYSVFSGLLDVSNGKYPLIAKLAHSPIRIPALQAIHESGWMHRDISTGNIILDNNRGILIDFEYAERIPKEGKAPSHGGRTVRRVFVVHCFAK